MTCVGASSPELQVQLTGKVLERLLQGNTVGSWDSSQSLCHVKGAAQDLGRGNALLQIAHKLTPLGALKGNEFDFSRAYSFLRKFGKQVQSMCSAAFSAHKGSFIPALG